MATLGTIEDRIGFVLEAFGVFALSDIEFMAKGNKPIGGFILASCYIDQLSMYIYNSNANLNFEKFITEYMPDYKDLKLQIRLRHLLVHHYVTGKEFVLTTELPDNHLKPLGKQTVLNLNDFLEDLKKAFEEFKKQVNEEGAVRNNVLEWSRRHDILKKGTVNHKETPA